ncbi:PTS system beta-glucoside-specific IIA component, Glc family /PTS system beta-glucoside-specific IIB component, Glc family /PTS system beta-glucoside-specific IIC component, Glc family [Microbacterium testaceum StLB037]|uniref:PTS system beta-glucoside-specific IIA component, Glc family /PTS system beta-glucoside-specific IIB component, Glc family /PTS system beta-glucoside-specific IIC component, Glc family n=1 Tax=Microbacterium testaceum (strain StLB037) TaxID=979556 RepID=A0A1H0MRC7_MICTS|nr:beta-glucoside-specific PTS transporter subunit IIABC [Microbacterium testaceum]SDO82710.1 PTS system beta-glucoside-specific IIA component, Glc family /PTS system beta-glucoside-specific IIB component, Glc family /PTS system beta-glucoside-specific IIC component, Glc family [Microbacterium testaceum StLB037]
MTTQDSARAILEHVGGAANVASLHHCSTRLRFTLADDSQADEAALKATPGVIGVVLGTQTQVIVGSGVNDYFRDIEKLRTGSGTRAAARVDSATPKLTLKRAGSVFMDFVVGVFTPIIPAVAGAGIFKSFLILAVALGWLQTTDQTYQVLTAIPDAVFFFLPLLVTYTAAKKLDVNIPLALGIVGLLVFPTFAGLLTQEGGVALFGLTVPAIAYNAQVFPPILAVLLLAVVERFARRISPSVISTFLVPLICFVIVAPATIFLLGPLGFFLGTLLTGAMLWLYGTLGWIAVALMAAALPFIVSVGMHKAFIPPTVATMASAGKESFYLVASLAHNLAEAGSSLAIAVRTKNKTLRGTAISSGISAFFGITEPALYGVTLQNRRAIISVVIGAFVGGSYLGIAAISAFALVSPGAASISMFIDMANPWNLLHAVIGALVAMITSFIVSLVIWKDSDSATVRLLEKQAGTSTPVAARAAGEIVAPMTGEVIALEKVDDPVFSGGILGPGVAIRPTDGEVRAPITGTVSSLLPSRHALGILGDDGLEVLVHVGLDTVRLEGAPFTAHVAQGDRVEAGQHVLTADLAAIEAAGLDITTPVVVLNGDAYDVAPLVTGRVAGGAALLSTDAKETANGIA